MIVIIWRYVLTYTSFFLSKKLATTPQPPPRAKLKNSPLFEKLQVNISLELLVAKN